MTLGKYDIPVGYYCGPSAIMLLTGREYEEVRAVVNEVRGRPKNKGVLGLDNHELISTVLRLGYTITERMEPKERKTLQSYDWPGHWIVEVSQHYVAICDNEIAENLCVWWMPITESRQPKRRVKNAWKLAE